jgi:hypothetical protein
MASQNALELVKLRTVVDIDQLSPEIAHSLGPFCDMTSNQALIAGVVTSNPDGEVVKKVLAEIKKAGKTGKEAVELAMDLFVRIHGTESTN